MIEAKNLTKEQSAKITEIVKSAILDDIRIKPMNGCGRVYLSVGYGKMLKSHPIAKSLNGVGSIKVMSRPYVSGVAFYLGYDNSDGHASTRAEHIAMKIRESGIPAFVDYDAD